MPYTGDSGASQLAQVSKDNEDAAAAQKAKTQPSNTTSATSAPGKPGSGPIGSKIAGMIHPAPAAPSQLGGMKLTMHRGGIVPGKKGEDVPIIAQAGEKIIPAGRTSEYRQVYMKRKDKRTNGK